MKKNSYYGKKEIQLRFKNIGIEIDEAFEQAKLDPFPSPEETFRNIYAN